jgi:hypothetical protein
MEALMPSVSQRLGVHLAVPDDASVSRRVISTVICCDAISGTNLESGEKISSNSRLLLTQQYNRAVFLH